MPVRAILPEEEIPLALLRNEHGLIPCDLRPGALNYAIPYPGWRFRVSDFGGLIHEPDPASAFQS